MTPKQVCAFTGTVGTILERTGVLGADGNWADPMPPQAVILAASEIEQALGQIGVTVPAALDQYFKLAGFIAPMIHG